MRNYVFLLVCFLCLSSQNTNAACPPSMQAYWPLDELATGSYAEELGAQDGSCAGSCPTPFVAGRRAYAQDFNGVDSGIRIDPSDDSFDWAASASFSLELWMNAANLLPLSEQTLLRRDGWSLSLASDGRLRFRVADQELVGSAVVSTAQWRHVLAEYSAAGQLRLFIDGSLDSELSVSLSGPLGSAGAPIELGYSSEQPASHYDGLLEQVALHQGLLSSAQRLAHARDGLLDFRTGFCESRPVLRIMPLGDSNTDGTADSGGYRQQLYSDLVNLGYLVDFVGSQSRGESVTPPFDTDHEGHWGWRDDQIAANIYDWLVANPADIILLHIGTNSVDPDPSDVEAILDEIDRYGAHVSVVLARIINRANYNADTTQFNQNIAAMAEQRIAAGDKIVIVDMEPELDYATDMADDFHPNAQGFAKMAAVWLEGVQRFFSTGNDFAPWITTAPVTGVALGSQYSYAVQARAKPAASFRFAPTSTPPAGMSIDSQNGPIEWSTDQLGSWEIDVEASNVAGSQTQSYTLNVTDDLIIDNGDLGTSSLGNWQVSSGPNPYGVDSLFSWGAGSSYRFSGLGDAQLELSLRWTNTPSRCTSVPVNIYDGQEVIFSTSINQQEDGTSWFSLGSYNFSEAASVELISSDNCSSSVDAARFTVVQANTLLFIEIEGPSTVVENSSQAYSVRAFYDDASERLVTGAGWTRTRPLPASIARACCSARRWTVSSLSNWG